MSARANAKKYTVIGDVVNVALRSRNLPFEEQAGVYFAGDYNLRGRTPKADVHVCFNGNIAISQVKLLQAHARRTITEAGR